MTDDKEIESDSAESENGDDSTPKEIKAIEAQILEKVPEEHRGIVRQALHIQQEFFQGPLPPPAYLRGYEDALPGSADRIITMAEKQQQHRMDLESKVVDSNIWMERLGLLAGFVLAMTFAIGSIWLIYQGNDVTGLVVIVTSIVGLLGTVRSARGRRQHELAEREKEAVEKRPALPPPESSNT